MDSSNWPSLVILILSLLALGLVAAYRAGPAPGLSLGSLPLKRLEMLIPQASRSGDWSGGQVSLLVVQTLLLVLAVAAAISLFQAMWGNGLASWAGGLGAAFLGALAVQWLARWAAPRMATSAAGRTVAVLLGALRSRWQASAGAQTTPEGAGPHPSLEEAEAATDSTELAMIQAIMELRDTTVWDVMVPRVDIVAVEADASFDEVARTIVEKGYSRLPVYEETIDNVIGIVHAREVLRHLVNGSRPASLREIIRPAYFVPDTKRVSDLLAEMRRARVSMAIVVDEYGGTAGLVTIEDLVEEVVGEIVDEFDTEEERVQRLSDDEAVLDARVSTEVLNELFGVRIESDEFETVGGFIYHHLGKVPNVGDEVRVDGLLLRVLSVLGRRIKKVYVGRLPPSPAE